MFFLGFLEGAERSLERREGKPRALVSLDKCSLEIGTRLLLKPHGGETRCDSTPICLDTKETRYDGY